MSAGTGAALRFVSSGGDGFDGQMSVFDPPEAMEFTWGTDRLRIELAGGRRLETLLDPHRHLRRARQGRPRRGRRALSAWTAGLPTSTARRLGLWGERGVEATRVT